MSAIFGGKEKLTVIVFLSAYKIEYTSGKENPRKTQEDEKKEQIETKQIETAEEDTAEKTHRRYKDWLCL